MIKRIGELNNFKRGDKDISAVYRGDVLIWPTAPIELDCFEPYQDFMGRRYFLYKVDAFCPWRTWTSARDYCFSLGGYLAWPRNQQENDFMATMAYDVLIQSGLFHAIWIGITDQVVEGVYTDVFGNNITYTNWNGGEPNNTGNEDVVEMYPRDNGEWNDLRDVFERRFIIAFDL